MADEYGGNSTESFALGVILTVIVFIFFHKTLDKFLEKFAPGGDGANRGGGGCGKETACNCGGSDSPANADAIALGGSLSGANGFSIN